MNFQTAAIVAGAAFLLSFLSGLIGGVPFLDIVLRALVWAGVGFGGSLGVETLLRSLVPDLFAAPEPPTGDEPVGQAVNITLDDEVPVRSGFVEEVGDDGEAQPERLRAEPPTPGPAVAEAVVSEPLSAESGADEEMPEIGSFLDAFKPESSEEGEESAAPASPGYSEYAPVESSRSGKGVSLDGETQDPTILAKAVQTVMKRDTQGN
jgi:hypothetical protein